MSHWRGINSRKLMLSWGIGKINQMGLGIKIIIIHSDLGPDFSWKIARVCKFVHAWKIVTNNNNHLLVT